MKSLSTLLAASLIAVSTLSAVQAQVSESGTSSTSSTSTEATVKGFAFKYKEKFDNYAQQIDMGITKGWLNNEQADTFKKRLADLRAQESTAAKANYPDDQIASLDKATTKFNEDLSSSSTKTSATADDASKKTETK